MRWIFTLLFFSVACFCVDAQDGTRILDDIIISDIRMDNTESQSSIILSDSLLAQNTSSVTDILNFNTPIRFNERGNGMVSSPSFRGTTASQTVVLWNGININSKFLGSSNFNTFSFGSFDEIVVKPGGGSFNYGSGAIGGTVHLNNKLSFSQGFEADVISNYGSFSSWRNAVNTSYSTNKSSFKIGYNHTHSKNDYEVSEWRYKNENGQFSNRSLNFSAGYVFSNYHSLSFYSDLHDDITHFSLITPNSSRTKYSNKNARFLLKYDHSVGIMQSTFRVAKVTDRWRYFENINEVNSSGGNASTWSLKYDSELDLGIASKLMIIAEYSNSNVEGIDTGIGNESQKRGTLGVTLKQGVKDGIVDIGLSKKIDNVYAAPLLYSIAGSFPISNKFTIGCSLSKNFRAPTFNDLFWEPGGNKNLKPENSVQLEMNGKLKFGVHKIGINVYQNTITQMIRWIPGVTGVWSPLNVDKARIRGLEVVYSGSHTSGNHKIETRSTYAYTKSINVETQKEFVYVPNHKWTAGVTYHYNKYILGINTLLVGNVFTLNDNLATLDGYQLFNIKSGIQFNKHILLFEAKNIFDKAYEAYQNRPMAGRNFSITIKFSI